MKHEAPHHLSRLFTSVSKRTLIDLLPEVPTREQVFDSRRLDSVVDEIKLRVRHLRRAGRLAGGFPSFLTA
jgi:hypothetical protein